VKRKLLISMGFLIALTGCAQLQMPAAPAQAPAPAVAQPCADCNAKPPYYAVAVTRPALCNDYPVEYRVQVPESDARVRPVDRMVLADGAAQVQAAACWK